MKNPDIVVINDMHPSDFPGAATIALNHAKYLSSGLRVEFWHTSISRTPEVKNENLVIRAFYRNRLIDKLVSKSIGARIAFEFIPSFLLLKILIVLLIRKPKIVWVNQIGTRIPKTLSLLLPLLRLQSIQTFHDFNVIAPRKLFPENIVGVAKASLSQNCFVNFIYKVRCNILVYLTRKNLRNICISELQANLLERFGVRNIEIVPNGIEICRCLIETDVVLEPKTILFAGRSNGKGFERACILVKNNPSWTLLAAGKVDLENIGKRHLPDSQFRYLGFLQPQQLRFEIHKADFVAVISDCFDVYPTVALEAWMHGSKVITSPSTGAAGLIEKHGVGRILFADEVEVNLDSLREESLKQLHFPVGEICLDKSGENYKSIFTDLISPR